MIKETKHRKRRKTPLLSQDETPQAGLFWLELYLVENVEWKSWFCCKAELSALVKVAVASFGQSINSIGNQARRNNTQDEIAARSVRERIERLV